MKSPLESFVISETGVTNRESLEKYKVKTFIDTINYAKKNSIFYKQKLKEINTDIIQTTKDIAQIPFTYPEDIAKNYNQFLCVPQKYVSRIVTLKTSGTSNVDGKRIFFTDQDLNLTVNFFENGFKSMVNQGDKVMIMMPGDTYGSLGHIIKKSLDRLNIENFIYGVLKDCHEAGKFIQKNSINAMVALPMQAMYFSKIKEDIFKTNIKKLMLSADYVPEVLIKRFSKNYNIKVFTHYGLTETGYGCGVECQQLEGYHIRENDIYLEIIDPITGCLLEDDHIGEIVLTTFNRQAMPLIRYRTGDYGLYKSKGCKCGTFLKTLERSKGRIGNGIRINNQYIHMSQLDEFLFQYESILDYSVNLKNNQVNVKVFLSDGYIKTEEIKRKLEYIFNSSINIIFEKEANINLSTNTMIKRVLI